MASHGEGNAKPFEEPEPSPRSDSLGGPRQLTTRLTDLPGWAFALQQGRVAFVSAPLATWLGYESALLLRGKPASALVAGHGTLSPRDQSRLLLGLQRRDGTTMHVEMACLEGDIEGAAGLLFWAPGQGAELPSRPQRSSHMAALVAGLAHELNNPLTYLTLNLGFVDRELHTLSGELGRLRNADEGTAAALRRNVDQASEALRVATEGVERMATIVRDLRAFSRAGDGVGPVDPRRTLEMALALTRNNLRHKARLQLDLGEVDDVEANEAQLGQALVSLLLALVQGIEDGTASSHTLAVHLAQQGPDEVELRLALSPPPRLDLASEPDAARCRVVVASFGGSLLIDGPSVVVRLRVARPVEAPPLPSPPSPRSATRPRVLIVDDEPQVAEALQHLLAREADAERVSSGREAIDLLLRDQRFDLILCDMMMPDIGGMDVHEAIRRARPGVEARIVFLTGGAFTPRTRDFLRAVPNRALDKPVDPELLLALVRAGRG